MCRPTLLRMVKPLPEFVAHCAELLHALGPVRVKPMFGGHGLYVDELFVAIVAWDQLYLKADALTRARFEAAGCAPFVYDGGGKSVSLNYWVVPEEALESPALMLPWACLAQEAALRARAKGAKPRGPRKTRS
jgi:DNA transformation protein and related proteins